MAALQIGDRVRLLKLDEWFFKDIPTDDVEFLKFCIGRETELLGFDDYGHAELEFVRSETGKDFKSHTVWVDQKWIEKA